MSMELKLINGDYVPDGMGGLQKVTGSEELLQRVLFKLQARRGGFAPFHDLGSRLYLLGREKASGRQSAAEQYIKEALSGEPVTLERVRITEKEEGPFLEAELCYGGGSLPLLLELGGEKV